MLALNKIKKNIIYLIISKIALKKIKTIKYQNKNDLRLIWIINKNNIKNNIFNNLYINFKKIESKYKAKLGI